MCNDHCRPVRGTKGMTVAPLIFTRQDVEGAVAEVTLKNVANTLAVRLKSWSGAIQTILFLRRARTIVRGSSRKKILYRMRAYLHPPLYYA